MASVGASVYATWIQVGNVNPYPFETRIHIHLKQTSYFHTTIGSCLRESTSSNYSSFHTTYRSDSLFHSQEKKSYIHDDNNNNARHKCDCEVRYALLPSPSATPHLSHPTCRLATAHQRHTLYLRNDTLQPPQRLSSGTLPARCNDPSGPKSESPQTLSSMDSPHAQRRNEGISLPSECR